MAVLELFNAFPDEAAAQWLQQTQWPRHPIRNRHAQQPDPRPEMGHTWHYIRIERDLLTITVRHYNPTVGCFGSGAQHKFMYTNGTVGWHSIRD